MTSLNRRIENIEQQAQKHIVQPDSALAKSFGDSIIGMTEREALDSVFGRIKEMRQKHKNGTAIKDLRKQFYEIT